MNTISNQIDSILLLIKLIQMKCLQDLLVIVSFIKLQIRLVVWFNFLFELFTALSFGLLFLWVWFLWLWFCCHCRCCHFCFFRDWRESICQLSFYLSLFTLLRLERLSHEVTNDYKLSEFKTFSTHFHRKNVFAHRKKCCIDIPTQMSQISSSLAKWD